ncbi:MAG TPA: C39 family peptidase [Pirellulales bacterium]|nr:C39 family peptidase [Pirellulales bacterium]
METQLTLEILPQPDGFTCGPTCLQAVYRYYGDKVSLEQVIAEVPHLEDGGTLDVLLACHALRRGYQAKIFTYNVQMFDPTWFGPRPFNPVPIKEGLRKQMEFKKSPKLAVATEAYLEFLDRGGVLRFDDLTTGLIRKYLSRGIPLLTGLSSTYLYRSAREYGPAQEFDDVRGVPSGHFVVLCGYDATNRQVLVADPLGNNPVSASNPYPVSIDRVIGAILLGIITYDANLLMIEPPKTLK